MDAKTSQTKQNKQKKALKKLMRYISDDDYIQCLKLYL